MYDTLSINGVMNIYINKLKWKFVWKRALLFFYIEKVSLEELSPRDATAINIPEKKQLEPISVPVANGVETSTSGNPPLPPIRHWIELFIYF